MKRTRKKLKSKSGIYRIINSKNDKIYIGSSKELRQRFYTHRSNLRRGTHINRHLQNSFNKYGSENFKFELILYCEECQLNYYEENLIDCYESYKNEIGYNWTRESIRNSGKDNPMYGKNHTKESKQKMSKNQRSFKGKNNPFYGKTHDDETMKIIREKLQGKNYGVKGKNHYYYKNGGFSEEHKKNIGDACRGEDNGSAKLNKEQVKEIKRLLKNSDLYQHEIAKKFNVTQGLITDINVGRAWDHIQLEENNGD